MGWVCQPGDHDASAGGCCQLSSLANHPPLHQPWAAALPPYWGGAIKMRTIGNGKKNEKKLNLYLGLRLIDLTILPWQAGCPWHWHSSSASEQSP